MLLHEFSREQVSRFSICQAHAQLESDYNVAGCLRERPSNKRRNESTSCQLSRIGYSNPYDWVDICCQDDDTDNENEVRTVYLENVLKWGLPIDAEMMTFIKGYFVAAFVAHFPQCAGVDYLQGR